MSRYLRGNIDEEVPLVTLAAKTLVSAAFAENVDSEARISSIVARYSLSDFTPAAADGPILVGLAHSDYSDAEIEAWLELTSSWAEGNLVASKEVANRLCRRVGIFDTPATLALATSLNDGKAIKTKLNWLLIEGQTIKVWAYNMGTSALTSGAIVHIQGHANLWPQ